jgi:hypothetical protein
MEKVFKKVSEFSEKEQEILGHYWIKEINHPDFIERIKDEMKWDKSFSESQDVLEMMADKALKEVREACQCPPVAVISSEARNLLKIKAA